MGSIVISRYLPILSLEDRARWWANRNDRLPCFVALCRRLVGAQGRELPSPRSAGAPVGAPLLVRRPIALTRAGWNCPATRRSYRWAREWTRPM